MEPIRKNGNYFKCLFGNGLIFNVLKQLGKSGNKHTIFILFNPPFLKKIVTFLGFNCF